MKASNPNKALELKDRETFKAGKFCNFNFTLERRILKYLKCWESFLFPMLFSFQNVTGNLGTNNANISIYVWENAIYKHKSLKKYSA